MIRIFDIALKDLLQLRRDFKTFMFLIIMPIVFTFLFGFAFGAFSHTASDPRLPVGYLDQDGSRISGDLRGILDASDVIRLDENSTRSPADLDKLVADDKLAAAIIVPNGYGKAMLEDKTARLIVIASTGTAAWTTVQAELLALVSRLDGAVRTATLLDQIDSQRMPFAYGLKQSLAAWDDPPIKVVELTSPSVEQSSGDGGVLSHFGPGMMLQFAIAGLLTAAQVIVSERKSRTFQRLLTTATHRVQIVLGHYLAILIMILAQFLLLMIFGQFVLRINYLRLPNATLLVAVCAAVCIAALGLLIGILARSEEQAAVFSIIFMFVFAGLGGAWVPLEVTGATFQAIGHITPIAWAMDGFENITARGLGFHSILLPAAALVGYAVLFFALAMWRLSTSEEKQ
ncbi:MAG TPA: ABC transporter permease [Anaerolineales bacterium]|nr:ABC transporter permease [Anaerolineales bacterium]